MFSTVMASSVPFEDGGSSVFRLPWFCDMSNESCLEKPSKQAQLYQGTFKNPMIIENDGSCKNGYSLRSDAPAISEGGTMRIFKNNQPLAWVNVGSFIVSGGDGCQDVGLVESFVINWVKGGNRQNASNPGIPVNGGYGWVCKS